MLTVADDELYQGYLTKVYQHTQGYQHYSPQQQTIFARANICATYGELLYPSVKKLLQHFKITPADVFCDLGSGLGKCALQIFMQSDLKKVIAIEAAGQLHAQAQLVQLQLKNDFPLLWEEARQLQFMQGNFLTLDWQAATILYSCSTCFTEGLLVAIGDKINTQPQVRQVFSLRPLPTLKLPLRKVFEVECSWDSALCFYYER